MFFRGKKKAIEPLLKGMIDIHSHLLWGVDDGACDADDTVAIVKRLKELGVGVCYATPHILPSLYDNTEEQLEELFVQRVTPIAKEFDMSIKLAAEYMICPEFITKLNSGCRLLTILDNHILVEVEPYNIFSSNTIEIFSTIKKRGYIPILAHPERYQFINSDIVYRLKDVGGVLQLNLLSLAGYYGKEARGNAIWMLDNMLYSFVGLDCHQAEALDMVKKINVTAKSEDILLKLIANNISIWNK